MQPGQTISRQEVNDELQRQAEATSDHLAASIPYWSSMNANQRCCLLDCDPGSSVEAGGIKTQGAAPAPLNGTQRPVPIRYCPPGLKSTQALRSRITFPEPGLCCFDCVVIVGAAID